MAVISRYELRVEGLLKGDTASNGKEIDEFKSALRETAPPAQGGPGHENASWPGGVIIKDPKGDIKKDYTSHIWKAEGYDYAHGDGHGGSLTMLVFHAEFSICFPGSSHNPYTKERAVKEYAWFLDHDQLEWCKTLMTNLHTLNTSFTSKGKLYSPVMMKRFHWYIGNGGC